jgi:hypothetical protein
VKQFLKNMVETPNAAEPLARAREEVRKDLAEGTSHKDLLFDEFEAKHGIVGSNGPSSSGYPTVWRPGRHHRRRARSPRPIVLQ